jgi:hypothetical protein
VLPVWDVARNDFRGERAPIDPRSRCHETDQQDVPATATKEKVAEIAADFMTTFYGVQIGALETQELRTTPIPFWLVCFSDTVTGPMRQLFFVVVLPDGSVVSLAWRNGCRCFCWSPEQPVPRASGLEH